MEPVEVETTADSLGLELPLQMQYAVKDVDTEVWLLQNQHCSRNIQKGIMCIYLVNYYYQKFGNTNFRVHNV